MSGRSGLERPFSLSSRMNEHEVAAPLSVFHESRAFESADYFARS
jgi:hypothetical protein